MIVHTQLTAPVAEKAQRGTMELLLINHPLDCPVCDKGGECPLQNQAMANGQADSRFHDVKRTFPKPIKISAQVLLDRERCVLCARCTRFSQQIAGDPFIELLERGALQQVGDLRGRAVRLVLLRQHGPDLPGRRADRRGLPVPGPPVRPGLDPERLRALRLRLLDAHRLASRQGDCAGSPATTPRSTRSGTATRAAGPSSTRPRATGSPSRWSATRTASCAPPAGPRRSTSPPAAWRPPVTVPGSACCPAAG